MNPNQVLIVDDRATLSELFALNLKTYTNSKVVTKKSLDEGTSYIGGENTIDLIIIKDQIDREETSKLLTKFTKNFRPQVPIIILDRADEKESGDVVQLKNPFKMRDLIRQSGKLLKVKAKDMASLPVEEYFEFSQGLLFDGFSLDVDVFLYNTLTSSYELFLPNGNKVKADELEKFKNNKSLYVKSKDRLKLVNSLSEQVIKRINDPGLTIDDTLTESEKAQKIIFKLVNQVGIDKATKAAADASINNMKEICSDIPRLEHFLDRIMSNELGFMYQHSLLITYIGTKLLKQVKWGDDQQIHKLSFVAFFHDIALLDDEHHHFNTDEAVKSSRLSPEEKKRILDHAALSANLVNKFPEIPFGTGTIIKQHHGNKSGRSISKISSVLSPLSIIFMLSEEWATLLLEYQKEGKTLSKEKVLDYVNKKYHLPIFQRYTSLLQSLNI